MSLDDQTSTQVVGQATEQSRPSLTEGGIGIVAPERDVELALENLRPGEPVRPIFRPVQYLGSKVRVIDAISSLVRDAAPVGGKVADLFSGSSVVSQAIASSGRLATAVDAQRYSAVFAQALLGIGRHSGERVPVDALLAGIRESVPGTWKNLEAREDDLLAQRDAVGLRAFERALPLAWRSGYDQADEEVPLTSFYAGTYFGVRQALALDAIRHQVIADEGSLQPWTRAASLTALMHAASMIVHSAGKHFAQPLKDRAANASFLNGRLLSDRSLSVEAAFRSACEHIELAAPRSQEGHIAVQDEAERWVSGGDRSDVYYLDPPYTAQQYSRFYHVLETIVTGALPSLPAGSVPSSGLYPAGRYKSAFSSRSRAPIAFRQLLRDIAGLGATAIVSYSVSKRGSDGNARMVTLDELMAACHDAFGRRKVELIPLEHRYRQFNNAGNANKGRDDKEVLVLCKSA